MSESFKISEFFPIYDILLNQVKSTPNANIQLNEPEIKKLIEDISSMDKTGSDMIYVWIRVHSLRNSNSKLMDIPYGGNKLDQKVQNDDIVSDIQFDLRKFPPILNRLLQRFTSLHIQKMKEDGSKYSKNA